MDDIELDQRLEETHSHHDPDFILLNSVARFRQLIAAEKTVKRDIDKDSLVALSARIPADILYKIDGISRVLQTSRNAVMIDALDYYAQKMQGLLVPYSEYQDSLNQDNEVTHYVEEQLDLYND